MRNYDTQHTAMHLLADDPLGSPLPDLLDDPDAEDEDLEDPDDGEDEDEDNLEDEDTDDEDPDELDEEAYDEELGVDRAYGDDDQDERVY